MFNKDTLKYLKIQNRSHFIIGGLNYLHKKVQCTYCVHIILRNTFAAIEVGYG